MKRTTINRVCSEEYDPKVTQCCMWPLKIDFDEFKWDWILFPRSYDANFCSGDCSLGKLNFTSAEVQCTLKHATKNT